MPSAEQLRIKVESLAAVLQTALEVVAPGGKVVQVGLGADTCCMPSMQAVFKEVHFTGSWRYTNTVSISVSSLYPQVQLCHYPQV